MERFNFASSIRKKYKERLINLEKQWPPCHSDKLIRLELVERKSGEGYSANTQRGREDSGRGRKNENSREDKAVKQLPLAYGDLFKVESGKRAVRKVLVEGDAGIGKTTLSLSVSEDWANGKLFQQFELVLLLPLRMTVVASAGSLPELLKLLHPSPRLCESVARYLEEEEGKSVLIIADGWDELSESKRQEECFLYQLLFEKFPFISVLVTSRPSASTSLHRLSCIDRFAEIQGFSKENIKEYIESEFRSDQRKIISLLEQLEQNPLVESVCSVPLNCAIVCHLWRTLEEALPTTMTELYTKIILNIVLRNIQKSGVHKNILSLSKFDALPADLQESWWLLCKFAYQALENNQIVFSQEELADFFPQGLTNILCFGLLQSTEWIVDVGRGVSFHFLHFTIQEYLAALHLVKQLIDRQSSMSNQPIIEPKIRVHYGEQERFAIVSRFFFGIYFNVVGCNDCAPIKPYLSNIRDQLVRCHCAYEARNAIIEGDVIDSYNFGSLVSGSPRSTHDCAAMLYVIDKMQERGVIDILFSNCHVREYQIRTLTNSLASKDGKLQIKNLDLSGNKLTDESLGDLLHRASSAFQSLKKLNLGVNEIKPGKITTVLARPSCLRLSHLNLSGNNLGVSGLQALESVVSAGRLVSLEDLNLSGCLTDDADIYAAALATFLKSLSAYCLYLYRLDLSDNNLGVSGASALATAISQHNYPTAHFQLESVWLKWLNLNNTKLGDEGLCAFVKDLESPYCFFHLNLQNNSIHATGLTCFAKKNNKENIDWNGYSVFVKSKRETDLDLFSISFSYLDLRDNPLGTEGIIAIGEILGSCDQDEVDLSGCHLTTAVEDIGRSQSHDVTFRDVGQQLCQMPKSFISFLSLDSNCFTGERIHILAGFIHLCENLEFLSCRDCNITCDDLIKLFEILDQSKVSYPDHCSHLLSWNLDYNKIDDRGIFSLVHNVASLFPSLGKDGEGVELDGNPVSKEMVEMLRKKLYSLMCADTLSSWSDEEEDLSTSPSSNESAREEMQGVKKIEQKEFLCASPRLSPKSVQLQPAVNRQQLNEEIDFGNSGVSKHLGQIADTVYEREGPVAKQLSLTPSNLAAVQYPSELRPHTNVFQHTGYQHHADTADKPSTSQHVYEGRGDPQAFPQECATASATLSVDDIDLCRKRKSTTTQDEGNLQVLGPLHPQCIVQSRDQHVEQNFQPPPHKRRFTDDLQDVEHRFVDLIKWEDENGVTRELRIYSKIAHKWRQIATQLGFERGEIDSIEVNHRRNSACITAVLRRWFENAKNLPNGSRYPKSWQGLINLLEDAELGEVAGELKRALSSPRNSVRDCLS